MPGNRCLILVRSRLVSRWFGDPSGPGGRVAEQHRPSVAFQHS